MDSNTYPETMIVVITSHGKIPIKTNSDGSQKPKLLTIPDGMTLTKISAVAPGICNYIDPDFAASIVREVNYLSRYSEKKTTSEDIESLSEELRGKIKELTLIDLKKRDKSMGKDEAEATYLQQYNYHFDKICSKTSHSSCTKAIDKIYSIGQLSSSYDDNILFLNTPDGDVDYFLEIDPPYRINLHSILLHLKSKGVKNVIVIDLSCSVFSGNEPITASATRLLRREIISKKLGGKRKSMKRMKRIKRIKRKSIKRK